MSDNPKAALSRLARECAARHRPGAGSDNLPIVVLWGSRGSESSELLGHLHAIEDWPAPRAYLDGERLSTDLRPHQVANRLAFQLGRQVARFGRARFPRFFLGMQAAQEPLDPDSTAGARQARQELITQRLRNGPASRTWLRDTAEALARLAGLNDPVSIAAGLAVEGLSNGIQTLMLLRGAGMQWYHDGLGTHFHNAADALVELSVQEFVGNRAWVDEVLCRAFVADLQSEFDRGATLYARRTSAVALLDNVGKPAISTFLTMLAEQPNGSGPLLVVAASHQRFPAAAAEQPADWWPDDLGDASVGGWSNQRAARGNSRYYPVWIDPFDDVPATAGPSRPEVHALSDEMGLRPAQHSAVAFAHRLTAAHPAGLDLVFGRFEAAGGILGNGTFPTGFDLRGTLGAAHGSDALDDEVFDLVLGPWPTRIRGGLAMMATAVDLSDDSIAPILHAENQLIGRTLLEFRKHDLWVIHHAHDGRSAPPRLHPFARRAIAHRLGREGGIDALALHWDQAHALLRDDAAARDDRMAFLHHQLALGQLGTVAEQLDDLFDPVDPSSWYALLLQVTAAPLAVPDRAGSASEHFEQLCTGPAPDTRVTRRLVAALQLHSDPLGDPFHDMCGTVALELGQLAREAGAGTAFLLDRSSEFVECSNRWRDIEEKS